MAKRPPPGKCVHCLKESQYLNWDHVFPEAWYPETTPKDLYKWQIPSCVQCNKEYGVLERDLMIRIGLCLDPHHEESKGIYEKARRAIDPSQGKNGKEKKARQAKRRQLQSEAYFDGAIPMEAVYPNFGPDWHPKGGSATAIPISQRKIYRLAEKIVRGLIYLDDGLFVNADYEVNTYTLTDESAKPLIEMAVKYGKAHSRGPGITVVKATVPEDKISSLFVVEIWGRFRMYSVVESKDA